MAINNIYFSPTGTSAKISQAICEGISAASGAAIRDCNMTHESCDSGSMRSNDLAVIAAPVYGGKMAPMAKERMKHLRGEGTPCIVVAVYGNRAFENALTDMAGFVASLGFKTVGAAAFVGEHSYSTAHYPIAQGRPDREDLESAKRLGAEIGGLMMTGKMSEIGKIDITDVPSPAESMVNFLRFVADYAARQKVAPSKSFPETDLSLCIDCGQCVGLCPVGAISAADLHSVDESKCIRCAACVKGCPEGARTLSSPFAPVLSANFSARKEPVWQLGVNEA